MSPPTAQRRPLAGAAKVVLADEAKPERTPEVGQEPAPAPYCLRYGAGADEVCGDCGASREYDLPAFVNVGRVDLGPLCEQCAADSPFDDLARGLELLDDFVLCAGSPIDRGNAAFNVERFVKDLPADRWLPLILGATGEQS